MSKTSNPTEPSAKEKKTNELDGIQLSVEDAIAQQSPKQEANNPGGALGSYPGGLLEDPFGKQVGVDEIFEHPQLDELRELVKAATRQRSMMLLIGPPGVGKTTGVRSVTDELPVNKYTVVYLGQDQNGGNLLRRFAENLGLQAKGFRPNHVLQISQWLTDNLKNGGKQVILIVDEAHLLDDQTLEELRLLSNADYDRQSPLTLILLAQPWLRARLKAPIFEPLTQRLRYRYTLEGLGKDETERYIRSRMTKGGLNPALLTAEAIQQIFAYSEGIPRRVNNICTLVLLKARMAGLPAADAALVKAVAESLEN